MTLPDLLTAAEPLSESSSNWRYSVGAERPKGSKPASPGRVPSRYAGGSGLASHPFHRVRLGPTLAWRLTPRETRLAAAFLAGAFLVNLATMVLEAIASAMVSVAGRRD